MGDLIERREPDANENPWKRSKARAVAQAAGELTALRERVAAADKALCDGLVRASGARGLRISRLTDAIETARAILAKQGGEGV